MASSSSSTQIVERKLSVDVKFGGYSSGDELLEGATIVVGSKHGLRIYNFQQGEGNLAVIDATIPETSLVDKFKNLVAYVTVAFPEKLVMENLRTGDTIERDDFSSPILKIVMNWKYIIVATDVELRVLSSWDLSVLHLVEDIMWNPLGLCDMSLGRSSIVAWPSLQDGFLGLYDANHNKPLAPIETKEQDLAAISLSRCGTKVAVASQKSRIRVFDVSSGKEISYFSWENHKDEMISSLTFSEGSQYLVLGSNFATVKVFKIYDKEPTSYWNCMKALRRIFAIAFNTSVPNYTKPYATATLPGMYAGAGTAVAKVIITRGELMLLVVSTFGIGYSFEWQSGSMPFLKTFNWQSDNPDIPTRQTTPAIPIPVIRKRSRTVSFSPVFYSSDSDTYSDESGLEYVGREDT